MGFLGRLLGEDRLQHRRHSRALLGPDVLQGIAHPVNAAALERAVETPRRRRAQSLLWSSAITGRTPCSPRAASERRNARDPR